MANDHEIEVLQRLVGAIEHGVENDAAPDRIGLSSLPAPGSWDHAPRTTRGLRAQVVALGGVPPASFNHQISDSNTAALSPASDVLGNVVDPISYKAMLLGAFQDALNDRKLAASTRATISTAWVMLDYNLSEP